MINLRLVFQTCYYEACFAYLFVLFAVTAEAQITVKGTVLDDTNLPLAGTNVLLKDATGVGTVTDFDGNFTIEVPGIASPATSHVYKKKRLS